MPGPPPPLPEVPREQFDKMTKDQVVTLLILALQAQTLATRNLEGMKSLLQKAEDDLAIAREHNTTLEVELTVLRNKP